MTRSLGQRRSPASERCLYSNRPAEPETFNTGVRNQELQVSNPSLYQPSHQIDLPYLRTHTRCLGDLGHVLPATTRKTQTGSTAKPPKRACFYSTTCARWPRARRPLGYRRVVAAPALPRLPKALDSKIDTWRPGWQ